VPEQTVKHGNSRSLKGDRARCRPASTPVRLPAPGAFQAGHAGSIPAIRSHFLLLREIFRYSFRPCSSARGAFVPRTCHAETVHGDLRVPLPALRGVEVLDDAHGWTGIGVGFKVGIRVPGVATVATVRGHGEQMFVAVHGDTPRGVRVRLEGARWDEWIVGCADPEAVAATLASASRAVGAVQLRIVVPP
jgi:hypothetical protein